MNKKLASISSVAKAELPHDVPGEHDAAGADAAPQKRGFKPRWLRLQRRERKLREARAALLRPIVG